MGSAPPNQILIVRHGEKRGDPSKDDVGGPDLSIKGSARAIALPALFVSQTQQLSCKLALGASFTGTYTQVSTQGVQPRFSTPTFIFASKASPKSSRPTQTITPVSVALQKSFNDSYKDADYGSLAATLLNDSRYSGGVILICWHHGMIPNLAAVLGLSNPPKWSGSVFDRVWKITYSNGKASLEDLPQQLLYGDSSS